MEKNKTEIVKSLPSFINQLLLLMNSGMVLNEAFCKVAQGYGQLTPKSRITLLCRSTTFTKLLSKMVRM